MSKYSVSWWVDGRTGLKKVAVQDRIDCAEFGLTSAQVQHKVTELLAQGVYTIDIARESSTKR